ncbi:MAG TPA: SDR family NAD(P)-dependent oxidoreductase, partial [Novosphingobium sp.]|nr:SDR family NAD(P)-dependent oxidoreductase [Novosphingobium sp.]
MTGRSIIVTGGFGVLGQAVSAAFAAAGDRVARVDFAAAPIGGTPAGGLDIGGADLADAATAARVVADVVAAQGGLDVLVNVAGGFVWQPLADDDGTSWPRMFALNALTCRNMCAAALPALRQAAQSGRIGAFAARFHGLPTNRSHRVTIETDAPEILSRCREDKVDVAVLVPNCPVCHQTSALVARHLEANGIST